jgi:putative DNA primase/helicase
MISKSNLVNNVPMELQKLKQWVCWEARQRNERLTKVPVNPYTRRDISINEQDNWMTFEDAIASCEQNGLSGIGFVFTENDPYVGIDIDKCIDEQGNFATFAREITLKINSYTERSPSGRGIHIICKAILPKGRNKNEKLGLEMYDHSRYFTFTGDVVEGYDEIHERAMSVIEVYNKHFASLEQKMEKNQAEGIRLLKGQSNRKDILDILSRMKNSQTIMALYQGQWKNLYNSQSQADLAFCNALAFATGKDMNVMDRIFRESGLYRKKWDEVHYSNGMTYGQATLQKAIDGCTSVYEPKYRTDKSIVTIQHQPIQLQPREQQLPHWYEKDIRTGSIKFKPGILAKHLANSMNIKLLGGSLHRYLDGVYVELDDIQAKSIIQDHLRPELIKAVHVKDTLEIWKTELVKQREDIYDHTAENIINFQNGLFNNKTKEFSPHCPDHVSTVQLNASFDESAECPQFMRFLTDALHPEVIPTVQEIMGYLLVPVTKAQKAFIFYGPGRTGKSTLIGIIEEIIGDKNVSHVPLQKLEDRFDKASLFGKLLNTCADLPAKALSDTSSFKILTGEDIIQAERKFKDPFSFKNKARLLFSCNQLPLNEVDRTDGFYRRLLIVPFLNQVLEEKVDPYLLDRLKNEKDGIVQWALKGLERLSANGFNFTQCNLTNMLLDGYKKSSDSVQWFVEEYCEFAPEAKIYSKSLYEFYQRVCQENGILPKYIGKFIQELEALCGKAIIRGFESKTKRAVIKGIRLKEAVSNQVA